MDSAGETAKEAGGGTASVHNVYRKVVQAVLIFGADTWVLSEAM